MTNPEITRRRLLTAAAAATAVLAAGPPPARAVAAPPGELGPVGDPPPSPGPVHGRHGNADILVDVRPQLDVTAIRYTITNVGTVPDVFTVSYIDQKNNRQSKKRNHQLAPGKQRTVQVYGPVDHPFMLQLCLTDGTCVPVGPVGPVKR